MSLFFSPRFFRFGLPAVVGGGRTDFASYAVLYEYYTECTTAI